MSQGATSTHLPKTFAGGGGGGVVFVGVAWFLLLMGLHSHDLDPPAVLPPKPTHQLINIQARKRLLSIQNPSNIMGSNTLPKSPVPLSTKPLLTLSRRGLTYRGEVVFLGGCVCLRQRARDCACLARCLHGLSDHATISPRSASCSLRLGLTANPADRHPHKGTPTAPLHSLPSLSSDTNSAIQIADRIV
jgi:hypothetical protein